jgi:hypothetical protein
MAVQYNQLKPRTKRRYEALKEWKAAHVNMVLCELVDDDEHASTFIVALSTGYVQLMSVGDAAQAVPLMLFSVRQKDGDEVASPAPKTAVRRWRQLVLQYLQVRVAAPVLGKKSKHRVV